MLEMKKVSSKILGTMTYSDSLSSVSNIINQGEEKSEKNFNITITYKNNVIRSKKINKLESNLMSALIEPNDSDSRKRHVKRLIYGESVISKEKK